MTGTSILLAKINWDSPLPYLLVLLAIILFLTVKVLFNIRHLLRETASYGSADISFFEGFLKWSSENGKTVGIVLFIIVIAAVLWAINFS